MSYALEAGESVADGVRRVAREQADEAEASLARVDDDPEEAIHDARKRFKKVRAVLRLVRDDLGEDAFDAENTAWRDMGRLLSGVRNAQVAAATLAAVEERYAASGEDDGDRPLLDPAAFRRLHDALAAHRRLCVRRVVAESGAVDEVRRRLEVARDRMAIWPMSGEGFGAVAGGLKRVYRRGRNRFADAYDEPSVEAFHEWRKRVKYLWYHVRLLGGAWPGPLGEVADALHDLSDLLGDDHDLAELSALVAELGPRRAGGARAAEALDGLVRRRSAALRTAARPLARRIYAEKPKPFVARHREYWRAWRRQAPPVDGVRPAARR